MGKVGDLSALHDKYFDLGFRVVSISAEPTPKLTEKVIEKRGATYWIGSDPAGDTLRAFSEGEGGGIPRFYLVGADGLVVESSHGLPSEAEIERLLGAAYVAEVQGEVGSRLHLAAEARDAGAYGAARKLAGKLVADADAEAAAQAAAMTAAIERLAAFRQRMLELKATTVDANELYGQLIVHREQFADLPLEDWCKAQLRELKNHAEVKKYASEWRRFESAVRKEYLAQGQKSGLRRAKEMYEDVAKRYDRSMVGKLAAERAGRL